MSVVHRADTVSRGVPRRLFLRLALVGTVGLFLVESAAAFLSFFWPRRTGTFGGKLTVGNVTDFQVPSITRVVDGKFYLAALPEGFLALWQKCPHLGCTVPWRPDDPTEDKLADKGRFNCPCHSSIYNRYGKNVAGPAPRPMDLFKLEIVDGKIVVDTGKPIERADWSPDQAVKP
ncbi:MAG: ubiquinol-cytochrome c reductase iron-sulfur subunit [Chloroflexi bacterium]|nr:ubiquinol-cytochrome c reductase iron-sulfur subunit [Chloroflexota bacterium]